MTATPQPNRPSERANGHSSMRASDAPAENPATSTPAVHIPGMSNSKNANIDEIVARRLLRETGVSPAMLLPEATRIVASHHAESTATPGYLALASRAGVHALAAKRPKGVLRPSDVIARRERQTAQRRRLHLVPDNSSSDD